MKCDSKDTYKIFDIFIVEKKIIKVVFLIEGCGLRVSLIFKGIIYLGNERKPASRFKRIKLLLPISIIMQFACLPLKKNCAYQVDDLS